MKANITKWENLGSFISKIYDIAVQPSYDGWGSGFDPKYVSILDMWAKAEIEELPLNVRMPTGIAFYVNEFLKKSESFAIYKIIFEIEYLLSCDLYLWRVGQKEVFRTGFNPTSFLTLYAILESIFVDENLKRERPADINFIKLKAKEIYTNLLKENELNERELLYEHHLAPLLFYSSYFDDSISLDIPEESYKFLKFLRDNIKDYLREKSPRDRYDIFIEDFWPRYRILVEEAQKSRFIDLILSELRQKKGRIGTDIISKIPQDQKDLFISHKDKKALEIKPDVREKMLNVLKNVPEWMIEYEKQIAKLELLEKDITFISKFLPSLLEREVEHRGFIGFLIKSWDEEKSRGQRGKRNKDSEENKDEQKSQRDKEFEKSFGISEEEFKNYRKILNSVSHFVSILSRKLSRFLPKEEELFNGRHLSGKKINPLALATEIPIKRGKIFQRKEVPTNIELSFYLLIDISSSMRKENKIETALQSLLLTSEVLNSLRLDFAIGVFNDNCWNVKAFESSYKESLSSILELSSFPQGSTDLSNALKNVSSYVLTHLRESSKKGILIIFSDGMPTKGLKGNELSSFIRDIKQKLPIIGIGLGTEDNYIRDLFGNSSVALKDISELPFALSFIIENQFKRFLLNSKS